MTVNEITEFLASKLGRTKLWFAVILTPPLFVVAEAAIAVDVAAGVAAYAVACIPFMSYAFGQPSEKERVHEPVVEAPTP